MISHVCAVCIISQMVRNNAWFTTLRMTNICGSISLVCRPKLLIVAYIYTIVYTYIMVTTFKYVRLPRGRFSVAHPVI